jgi:hypothetical protein
MAKSRVEVSCHTNQRQQRWQRDEAIANAGRQLLLLPFPSALAKRPAAKQFSSFILPQ